MHLPAASAPERKNIIGFVVPDISNQFFARLIEAVEESISAEGFHLIIANTRENKERERQHLRYLTSGVVDGILLASTMETYGDSPIFFRSSFRRFSLTERSTPRRFHP